MPISEILIVYFAFGAPLAVYRFLETRKVSRQRRILESLATFVFWIPFAVKLSYRHLTNASSDTEFVSPRAKKYDSVTNKREEALESAMIASGCRLSRHDLREIIERYVGLSNAAATSSDSAVPGDKIVNFLGVAGRPNDLGARCLARRERTRLERHLDASRESFLSLFGNLSSNGKDRSRAIRRGVELALLLNDLDAADHLGMLEFDVATPENVDPVSVTAKASFSIGRAAQTID
ncbi:MAG TPA: hypothetical protein VJV05_10555 [Pyrinomonadaceae bacterium]|nr:hypothetical protein [Pyrinomonadaceae bacterium]